MTVLPEIDEIWAIVPSHPYVAASSLGRIRLEITRPNARWGNGTQRHKSGYIFKPAIKQYGYEVVRVAVDGNRKHFQVHRLVCEAFHGVPPTPKHHAAHKDGNQINNVPENLYWATAAENIADRDRHGTTSRGESHYCAKLKQSDIPIIKSRISSNENIKDIAKDYLVSVPTIRKIGNGQTWRN